MSICDNFRSTVPFKEPKGDKKVKLWINNKTLTKWLYVQTSRLDI